jgi:hypothetical protein
VSDAGSGSTILRYAEKFRCFFGEKSFKQFVSIHLWKRHKPYNETFYLDVSRQANFEIPASRVGSDLKLPTITDTDTDTGTDTDHSSAPAPENLGGTRDARFWHFRGKRETENSGTERKVENDSWKRESTRGNRALRRWD